MNMTLLVLGSIIFFYVASRSVLVPMTIDESITFFWYVIKGYWFPRSGHWTANNHLLNSLFTIWSTRLFGSAEWALRLPNLLALIMYLLYTVKWAKRVKMPALSIVLFMGLAGGQYVLDFFGVCRGYGLSLAFLLGSWFHLSAFWRTRGLKNGALALALGSLAVASNLSVLLAQAVAASLITAVMLFSKEFTGARRLVGLGLSAFFAWLPIVFFAALGFMLKNNGQLYYGKGDGFWEVTVGTLVSDVYEPWGGVVIHLVLFCFVAALMAMGIAWYRHRSLLLRSDLPVVVAVLLGSVVGQIFLHHAFGVNYASDRVGLYYVPLFVLTVVLLADAVTGPVLRVLLLPSLLLIMLIPINLLASVNLTYVRKWKWEAGSKQFFEYILQQKQTLGWTPTVGGSAVQNWSYKYYNFRHGWPLYSVQDQTTETDIPDFQYAYPEWTDRTLAYETALVNQLAGRSLMKRKRLRPRKELVRRAYGGQKAGEFFKLIDLPLDTLCDKDLLFEFEIDLTAAEKNYNGWAVLDVTGMQHNRIQYQTTALNETGARWVEGGSIKDAVIFPGSIKNGAVSNLYLWDIERTGTYLSRATVTVTLLEGDD